MRLFSYVVARDYGFAPNPFYGYCTLATCKPEIRRTAKAGDWIVGTGAKTKYNLAGHLVYAMQVDETLSYNEYWNDPRFACKRPVLNGSLKQLYGDNIYHRNIQGWEQADSHHSLQDGQANPRNVEHDTRVDRLLIARKFVYFGSSAPEIPECFRPFRETGEDICCPGRGYRVMSPQLAVSLEAWLNEAGRWGRIGLPLEFRSHAPHRQ